MLDLFRSNAPRSLLTALRPEESFRAAATADLIPVNEDLLELLELDATDNSAFQIIAREERDTFFANSGEWLEIHDVEPGLEGRPRLAATRERMRSLGEKSKTILNCDADLNGRFPNYLIEIKNRRAMISDELKRRYDLDNYPQQLVDAFDARDKLTEALEQLRHEQVVLYKNNRFHNDFKDRLLKLQNQQLDAQNAQRKLARTFDVYGNPQRRWTTPEEWAPFRERRLLRDETLRIEKQRVELSPNLEAQAVLLGTNKIEKPPRPYPKAETKPPEPSAPPTTLDGGLLRK